MDSVLIVSNTSSTLQIVSNMLQAQVFDRISTAQNGGEGRRNLIENDYDLIIIDSPLPDEFGDDFSLYAAENFGSGVIQIVDESRLDDINSDIEDAGVFVLPKPISPEFFYQAVKLLVASRRRLQNLEDENQKLRKKIDEMRVVNRAKLVLVQKMQMNEEQAHHYIEKMSMDTRKSRVEVSENIIRMYES